MPLYAYDDDSGPQPPVLGSEHWRAYARFEGGPLHTAFVAHIGPYLARDIIYSRQAGSEILCAIQADEPQLLEGQDDGLVGSLFGMTLWNVIAKRPEKWHWIRDDSREGEPASTYFRATRG